MAASGSDVDLPPDFEDSEDAAASLPGSDPGTELPPDFDSHSESSVPEPPPDFDSVNVCLCKRSCMAQPFLKQRIDEMRAEAQKMAHADRMQYVFDKVRQQLSPNSMRARTR